MRSDEIRRILKKYRDVFETLEDYDRTRQLPFQKKRIDITLSVKTINRLKKLKEKTGKPVSRIIEESIWETQPAITSSEQEQVPEETVPSYIC